MAREGYRSLYGDLTKLKDSSLLDDPASGIGADDELFQLLMSTSDFVDKYCNQRFHVTVETRTYDGSGGARLLVPDLLSVTSLKEDTNGDGAYNVTWATTDYRLEPQNAQPTSHWGSAYNVLRARGSGAKPEFQLGEHNFEIAGTWGYRDFVEDSGSLVDEAGNVDASQTTIVVDDGADFAAGQTVRIDSEQLLVTAISTNTLTVVRALNGTTAAAHNDDATVSIYRWPMAVERATLINAARTYTMRRPSSRSTWTPTWTPMCGCCWTLTRGHRRSGGEATVAQPMTQRERLATLEAHHAAHAREHELWRELEATQLEAIGARLANIETALGAGRPGGNDGRRISRRDVGVFGGSIAMATALWWMVDLLRAASGG